MAIEMAVFFASGCGGTLQRGTPFRDTWLFVVFVVHIILFFIRKLFFSYVCAKVCLSLLTAIRPVFYVGT